MSESETIVADAFDAHRGRIFGVAYRMLGDAHEAEDVVQETFLRLHDTPPDDLSRSLEPWLVRVAVHLARDRLGRRSKERVRGEWLPSPVPDAELTTSEDPERRLAELQSVRLAFLHAAEALTPSQRAVYFLRVVFGWSGRETAEALGLSVAAVKTNLHRARATLRRQEGPARPVDRAAVDALMARLAARDVEGLRALLHEQIVSFADGGEHFFAARELHGAEAVGRLMAGLVDRYEELHLARARANGQPVILVEAPGARPGWAPRACLVPECEAGAIVAIRNVMDPRKLERITSVLK
jgi:RNA polymerase sigma-70 factor (ECF subfamily)